jgi:NAD(P)H-flavin reductase
MVVVLKEEWDQLAQAHPGRLDVKYVVDKAPRGWTGEYHHLSDQAKPASGETGFVTAPMLAKLFPRDAQRDDKVKAFVCGPPPQVNSICGPKDGPRQGELQGALKELGYSADEVFKF